MIAVLSWYLLILLAGWLAFPLAFRFLRFLPDRGYTLSKPLALLVWGYAFWLLADFNILQNNPGGVLIGLAILAALSALSLRGKWPEMRAWIGDQKRVILTAEAIFAVAFVLWALVRAANPQIIYTEKPMEMAFLNSIVRSPTFPPQDPWLSGFSISYYYFGYVMVSMLVRLTGTVTTVAFNVAIALWFALTAQAAFGILYNLLTFYFKRKPEVSNVRSRALGWAFLAPVFILLIGNMSGILDVMHSKGILWTNPVDDQPASNFWTWLDVRDLRDAPTQPLSWMPHRFYSWWTGSRVVQDKDMTAGEVVTVDGQQKVLDGNVEVIDEFPFFSYLLADMHPHLLGMPFVLLAVALALNLYLRGHTDEFGGISPGIWFRSAEFWLSALVFGGLSFLNTWDFPIYVGLFSAVYTLIRFRQQGWSGKRVLEFVEMALILGIVGIILYLPFYTGFSSQAGGLLPSMVFSTRGVQFWVMFAPMLVPIFVWLIFTWRGEVRKPAFLKALIFSGVVVGALWLLMILAGLGITLGDATAQAMMSSSNPAIASLGNRITSLAGDFYRVQAGSGPALFQESLRRRLTSPGTWLTLLAMLTLTWGLLSLRKRPEVPEEEETNPQVAQEEVPSPNGFVLLLVLLGTGLTLFPEYFYLLDGFGTRMNTIFKFYFQTWILWGLAAAFGFTVLWEELHSRRTVWIKALIAVTLALAFVYPVTQTPEKIREANGAQVKLTLDGRASFYSADEWASFEWLSTAPYGVVTEATGGQYLSQFARVGTFSGQPSVLGWQGHEGEWRGNYIDVGSRPTDLKTLYETNNWADAKAIIEKYHIRYIYIGPTERTTYRISEDKFKENLTQVFGNASVTIYEAPDYAEFDLLAGK
jgi:YYY domain-containing protein